jgi:hypothetical protein
MSAMDTMQRGQVQQWTGRGRPAPIPSKFRGLGTGRPHPKAWLKAKSSEDQVDCERK